MHLNGSPACCCFFSLLSPITPIVERAEGLREPPRAGGYCEQAPPLAQLPLQREPHGDTATPCEHKLPTHALAAFKTSGWRKSHLRSCCSHRGPSPSLYIFVRVLSSCRGLVWCQTCMTMVSELGVRFKPPGSVMTRAEKYAVFNSQSKKSKKK